MPEPNIPGDDLDQLKRALAALKKARARITALEQTRTEPIAIIGIGCRLPGEANTPDEFWQLLRDGRSAMAEPPPDRWDARAYQASHPDEPGKMQSSLSGFLKSLDQFDPHFFGIAPREANAMDPQQRLALEAAWEALEDAGIIPGNLAGSATGVFIGIGLNDYARLQIPAQAADPTLMDNYFIQGNALCITANRISYALDLRGPSMAIDTACSSSLVALHTACQSLRNGDSTLALVGGSNVILTPHTSLGLGKFLAPDGLCKTFDSRADGYTRGEGSIIFVLRRLSEAVTAGDRIYAVIRGSAINQDGFSSGLTVPNGAAQEAMLRAALENASTPPDEIDYVEAHGTGTSLGDPIEANALGAVFAAGRGPGQELLLGSVKTNIGHLEAGAGIAGALKIALSLYHGEIPASLNYLEPNPMIDFDGLRLKVVTHLTPWPERDHPRRAGVSSFGFGGANSHAILEAAPPTEPLPDKPETGTQLYTLSAKTPPALTDSARRLGAYLAAHPGLSAARVRHTLNRRRSRFPHRLAVAATGLVELAENLAAFAEGQSAPRLASGQIQRGRPKIAFLFTGQGAQYAGMGAQLYQEQPVFRAALDRCAEVYQRETGESLLAVLFPAAGDPDGAARIDQTAYTQPALFAIEYALAELWRSWGVTADAVAGHSIGEYVAACLAGVMSLEDGLRLVIARGRLMGSLPAGGVMAGVFAGLEVVERSIARVAGVSIAAVNAPDSLVISGAEEAVQTVLDRLAAEEIKFRRLVVSHAFHSALVEPILDEFERVAASCRFSPPRIPLISNLTGQILRADEVPDAAYWREHMRGTVQFATELQTLAEMGVSVFLECGPNPVLLGLGKRCLPEDSATWLPSLRQGQPESAHLLKSLGGLYCLGVEIDREILEGAQTYPPLSLPAYPFQRERYWFKTSPTAKKHTGLTAAQPLLGSRLRSPGLNGAVFETQLHPEALAYLWDHRAYETPIFPASGYIEMALSAAQALRPGEAVALTELVIQDALTLPMDEALQLQIVLDPPVEGGQSCKIYSHREGDQEDWQLHAYANLIWPAGSPQPAGGLPAAQALCTQPILPEAFYHHFDEMGMQYGPAFQNVVEAWAGPGQALARVALSEEYSLSGYFIHPALLDACLQVCGAALPPSVDTYLPVGFDIVRFPQPAARELWCHARLTPGETADSYRADFDLYNPGGELAGQVLGMRIQRVARGTLRHLVQRALGNVSSSGWVYCMGWRPAPLPTAGNVDPAGRWLVVGAEKTAEVLAAQLKGAVLAATGEKLAEQMVTTQTQGVVCLTGDARTALSVLQAACALPTLPNVWLVTEGGQPALTADGSDDLHVEAGAIWGLARSARLEYPDLKLRLVDLDPAALPEHNARSLLAELTAGDEEDEIAYRNDERLIQRMERLPATQSEDHPVRLEITARGSLDNLALRPIQRLAPGEGEVEIRVRAAGVNFRDVLNTLDMYPGDAGGLGHECSGVITAVGPDVTDFHVGQTVLALASECFASYVTTGVDFVQPKPWEMSFEQAATVPITFLTAAYALNTLARLQPGERVLIHAAAGGVGLAAVQLAQLAGAEIFATAGSPEKHALLRSLGIQHIMDSRSLGFSDEILRLTGGEGVDVALNSLADAFIPRTFAALRRGGRFLEIGKRGIWTHEQVAALGKDIDYHIIYLGQVCDEQPEAIRELFGWLMDRFGDGSLRPLSWRAYPLTQATTAFRFMAQAKHTGKIVLTLPAAPGQPAPIRADASYLITGGLGGLGLAVARRLAESGARHLILVGRSAPSESARAAIASIQASSGDIPCITTLQADIAEVEEARRVFALLEKNHPPLAGIVHAAGTLDDGLLTQQTWERYSHVFQPKLAAAWHLHHLSAHLPLDFFVLFSAGAGWLGSPGQTGYAAANTAVDALTYYRRARGLPAVSIAWGPWAEVGMAARMNTADQERMNRQGLGFISPQEGVETFERLLRESGALAVLPVDWEIYAAAHARPAPRFADLIAGARAAGATPATTVQAVDIRRRLQEAPPSKRKSMLAAHIREHAVRVLGLSAKAEIDPRQPLRELGMDSLMAVELRNALSASLNHKLPSTLLFDYPTTEALTDFLSAALWPEAKAEATEGARSAPGPDTSVVENLSDEEAEALLLAELDQTKPKPK